MTTPPAGSFYTPPGYVPPPAKNGWVKPLLIGCGSLFVVVLIVGGIGAYFAARAVGTAIHNSSAAAQVAQSAVSSAQQAVTDAGASPDPEHAATAGVAVLKSMVGGGKAHVQTLTREELKADLPSAVDSLARTSSESQSGGYAGISGTTASANYGSGESTISIELTDAANMSGLTTILGMMMGIESEDDHGYEKGAQIGDVKVHEKWTNSDKGSEIVGVVGDRFFVSVTGHGVDMSEAEKAFAAIDIAKLQASANATR